MASFTDDELALVVAWFETAELPPPPFRSAPWAEISEPDPWRQVMLLDLHHGPAAIYWHTALQELRWLAKRIAPPEIQTAAHVDELVEQHGRQF